MVNWFNREHPMLGGVIYRGTMLPRLEEFSYLDGLGYTRQAVHEPNGRGWRMDLRHPEYGSARVSTLDDFRPPPGDFLRLDPRLTEEDVEAILGCGNSLRLEVAPTRGDILCDRKYALRIIRDLMGDDGVAGLDACSQSFWPRQALEDELAHDAALDIESLYTIHNVMDGSHEDAKPLWVHTHGLAELGFFDFDALRPFPELGPNLMELMRAIAFAIVEGKLKPDTPSFQIAQPGGLIRMAPVTAYLRNAPPEDIELMVDPEGSHQQHRSILGEPIRGPLAKLFSRKVRPNKWLSRGFGDGTIFYLSNETSRLVARRARDTYPVLRTLSEEFEQFRVVPTVKIGEPTDNDDPEDREHLWFQVDQLKADSVVGTLVNAPYNVAGLQKGQQVERGIDTLSDWQIFTPAGSITPRSMVAARVLRANADQILQMLREHPPQ